MRSCGVGSKPTTDRAGLTTVTAQSMPHTAYVHAATLGGAGVGCTPWMAPHPGQVSASVESVAVKGSRS